MSSPRFIRSVWATATLALALVTMIFVFNQPVMAQATTGSLKGVVADANGAVVSGATVTAKNDATGIQAQTTSNGDGIYEFANLAPGTYTVTTEAKDFKRTVSNSVEVKVGQVNSLDVKLQAGAISETVTVTAGTEEIVNREQAQISSSFETRKVAELPSNAAGSGLDTLALLAPGVVPGFGNVNSNGTTLSVNGNRARANNFTLDGTDNNDLTIGGPNFFVDNQDAVQEFQLVTNNFSAQYGRNQGAIINIVTKGGTNEFHGSGFEFHRNASALDAMTNDERADPNRSKRDKFISNVFGGTFGGPIKKNKAFFFVDGQLIRQRQQFLFGAGNPAITAAGLATLSANFPGNPAISALVHQSLFGVQPTARSQPGGAAGNICFPKDFTQPCSGANAVLVPAVFPMYDLPLPFDQKEYGVRGDVNPTSKDSFNMKFRFQSSPETNANSQSNGSFGDVPFTSKNLNGQWTRQITGKSVNEFRAAWQKLSVFFGGCSTAPLGRSGSAAATDPLGGCIPDSAGIDKAFTNMTFTGITASGVTLQSLGPATNVPQGRAVRVIQFADNFSHTMGRHSMIVGLDYHDTADDNAFLPNLNGAFLFGSTARLVANAPTQVTIAGGTPIITYKEKDKFVFFQDDYKVRDNLTLNLGIRYEYTGQPFNTLNALTTARESDPARALWRQSLPLSVRTVPTVPVDKNNWAPRFGFAWTPHIGGSGMFHRMFLGDNDATVIRGGYSIAYDPAFYNILLNVSTSAPSVFLNTIVNTGGTASPLFRLPANPTGDTVRTALGSFLQKNTFDPRFLNQTQVSPDFHSPYEQQWSLGVQRQINRNNVVEARYVGNHAVGLFQNINRNPFIANLFNGFSDTEVDAAGTGTVTRTFPAFRQFLGGAVPQVCVNDPATPDNEGVCNGRLVAGRGRIVSRENTAQSTYNGLQLRYNGRLANQLTVGASYAFSKTLDNASEVFTFGENAYAKNFLDPTTGEKSYSANDRRHAGSLNVIWDLPFFKKQEGFTGHLLGGWQINGTYVLTSGRPFTPSQFFDLLLGQGSAYTDVNFIIGQGISNLRPFRANPNARRDTVAMTDWDVAMFLTGQFIPSSTGYYSLNELNRTGNLVPVSPNDVRFIFNGPEAARRFGNPFGTVGRNSERGPALNQVNIGFFKNTKVGERLTMQLRAELFNALNHPNPGYGVAASNTLPDTVIEDAGCGGTAGSFCGFNDPKAMGLSSRRVQLGIRLIF